MLVGNPRNCNFDVRSTYEVPTHLATTLLPPLEFLTTHLPDREFIELNKLRYMYSYALLQADCYYLIQEEKGEQISLVKINVVSDHCVFVSRFKDEELLEWKRKSDPIYDIIELLSDDKVSEWQLAFNNTFYFKEEDDDYE